MNPTYLYAAPLLLLASSGLFALYFSSLPLRTLRLSGCDWLILPFVGLYLMLLVVWGWVFNGLEFFAHRPEDDLGEQHSSPQFSRRPHHSTT